MNLSMNYFKTLNACIVSVPSMLCKDSSKTNGITSQAWAGRRKVARRHHSGGVARFRLRDRFERLRHQTGFDKKDGQRNQRSF